MKISDYYQIIKPKYKYLKIIPHSSARNNKSDEIASQINSMYKSLKKRITKENNKLIIESQCKLSYYIYITKSDVNFYFIVPEYYLNVIKSKITNTWSKKVNVVEVEDIPTFSDNASKCCMSYKNKDGLSLATDKRNNDLLASNLSVINTMKERDAVGIIYNMLPSSPREERTWLNRYNEDYEDYKNNRNIQKINLSPGNLVKMALIFLIKGLNAFISEIQIALKNENIQVGALEEVSTVITNKRSLSNSTLKKKNACIVKTQIAVLAESENKNQQEKLLDVVSDSFKTISEDNELVSKHVKSNFDILAYQYKMDVLETSTGELNNGIAIPGNTLLEEHKEIKRNELTESPLPKELKTGYMCLGTNKYKNYKEKAYLNASPSLINLPTAICGGSRSGKTTLTENIAKNIIDAGESLVVFDFIKNCELAENIRTITPLDRLIDLDLAIPKYYQAFAFEFEMNNKMSALEKIKIANRQIEQILNLIDSINKDGLLLTGKMSRYLMSAGKLVFLESGKALKDVIRCLQNHKYRNDLINNLNEEYKKYLEEDIDNLMELNEYDKKDPSVVTGTKESKIEGILDRINLLKRDVNMNLMYSMPPDKNINFYKAMNEGKVILIRLREDEFSSSVSKNVMVTFFITKIWLAALMRSKIKNPTRCTVIIDEVFQTSMAQALIAKQLVQSAKFNVRYIFTLHYLNQFSKDAQEALKNANASYILISGCDKKAYKELEEEFQVNGYELNDLLKLEQYTALNLIKTSKAYASFITKLPPPIH